MAVEPGYPACMQELHYRRSGGSGAQAADVHAVTVVFVADADKLVPSAEDWPKVRHCINQLPRYGMWVMHSAASDASCSSCCAVIVFKTLVLCVCRSGRSRRRGCANRRPLRSQRLFRRYGTLLPD